jgi:ligand-binding sensor domain-containing protein
MKTTTSVLRKNLVAVFLFCIQSVIAQNPLWMNFTNGDMITDMAENGNILWVGTSGGLVKYDKTTLQTTFYNKGNSGLPRNQIIALAVDANDNLWLITEAGLSNYDGSNWTIYDTLNSNLPNQYLNDIAIDQNGLKWIASGYGLISFDGTNWAFYDTSNSGISSDYAGRVFVSPANEKWISSYAGIDRYDGTNWTNYQISSAGNTTDMAFTGNAVYACMHGDFGQGEGLEYFDGVSWSSYTPTNSGLPYWRSECLDVDTSGNLWIGNWDAWGTAKALVKFDGVNWSVDSTGLPQFINHLEIDNDNRFYSGTEQFGLSIYDGNNFTRINTSNSGLNANGGSELCIDDVQDVWTVNNNGFAHFDRQIWNAFDSSQTSFLNSGVICIARDHSSGTWIGTNEGVIKYDGANWIRWDTSNSSLTNQYISVITVDPDNATWVGTQFAPFKFDGNSWTDYFSNAGSNINDLFVSDDGDVWIGSPGYGLNRFDRVSTWTNYTPPSSGNFQAGAFDKNGNVWYGGSNLRRWDGSTWITYTTSDGLPWNFITALAVDTNNILWIGTQSGLSSYDGNSFTNYFDRNSGLTADYISDIDIDSFNNKWICTSNGISVYNESGVVMSIDRPTDHRQAIQFFPNPAEVEINMTCGNDQIGMQLVITDMLGNEVSSCKIVSYSTKIDVSELAPGLYIGGINSDGQKLFSGKLVIR